MANKTTITATEIKKNSICIIGITHTSIKNNTNKTVDILLHIFYAEFEQCDMGGCKR